MKKQQGAILPLVLVFGAVFVILLVSLLSFVVVQSRSARQEVSKVRALNIAEAGLNYYRWHLAHDEDDVQDGQGWCCTSPPCSVCGPYEHQYEDPESGLVGYFSLEIEAKEQCGQITAVTITSTGWTEDFPDLTRKARVKYIRPAVSDYAYLINDNVWAGSDRNISGPYRSNGGVRMDGTNNALVTSAQEDWACTDSLGCSSCPDDCNWEGGNCMCPGVFTTANGKNNLFSYPVSNFDFDGITMDLANIKNLTDTQGQGIYLGPSAGQGYHLIFNGDSVDVYRIDNLDNVDAYNSEIGFWHEEDSLIASETFLASYNIPSSCSLIFVEDDLWVEGTVGSKITTVSADLIDPNQETDVWINGDITYTSYDGSCGFVLLGQHNVLIGLEVPDDMRLDGVYIAQSGRFGRNSYSFFDSPWHKRNSLEMFGSVVSNGRVGTKWFSGPFWTSGFDNRINTYDPSQAYNPPPFLPFTSEEHAFKDWEELEE